MSVTRTNNGFSYYMHDGMKAFSFEIAGTISDSAASELDQAWRTASSTADGDSLIVDLTYVTRVDQAGRRLLREWYDAGAQLVAKRAQARNIVASITGQAFDVVAEAPQFHTWRPLHAFLALFVALLSAPAPVAAAELKPETVQAWQQYVESVNARNDKHLAPGNSFLSIDEVPGRAARLREGEIFVSPAGPHVPVRVASGLIHDWMGAAFIPNATLAEVLHSVRDYAAYKDVYHPNVVDSKPTATTESADRFSLLLMNRSVIAKTALDGEYRSAYTRMDDQRWYSITETTRIREIADYGTNSERTLPQDQGSGLIWRLYSIARFQERDGGVYIEVEAIALSRDIPVTLRWMAEPIVRRVSRSSLQTSLKQTQEAVQSGTRVARGSSEEPRVSAIGASPVVRSLH